MYISIENEIGKINLNGGIFRILTIDGLGLCEKDAQILKYSTVDGQEVLNSRTSSREITVSGDILRHKRGAEDTKKAIRILNRPCVLKIQKGSMKRKIKTRCSLFSAEPDERNAVFQKFIMQLVADFPFFEDFEEKNPALFERENLIKNSFTLPCMFSRRVSRVNIPVFGDELVRPKIFITCETEGEAEEFGISLKNHTTNQSFTLSYKMSEGEEICIDFENRTIESSLKDTKEDAKNMLVHMAEGSFMDDFYFVPGINDVETVSFDASCKIAATARFSNKYAEAVI